jgi:2-keto-4-pentenoate hydratase/2-oxohepta-3-ene-1,7-dioic acid hydratase in catechol pathway
MKLCRYQAGDGIHLGLVNHDQSGIFRLKGLGIQMDSLGDLIGRSDELKAIVQDMEGPGDDRVEDVEFLAPVDQPTGRIICLGKNYRDHANEVKSFLGKQGGLPQAPIYFGKMVNRIMGPSEDLHVDLENGCELDYEVEMAFVVGRKAKNLSLEEAKDVIFAYTIVNDLTDRAAQRRHMQWLKGKSIDNTFPMGPYWVTADSVEFPPKRRITCAVNDDLRQDDLTDNLLFSIEEMLVDLSGNFTLMPGDLIVTGTPAGVGMGFDPPKCLNSGDTVTCQIDGIGWLKNKIVGI